MDKVFQEEQKKLAEIETKIDEINDIFTGSVSRELDKKLKENAHKQLGDKSKGKGPEFNFDFSSIRPTNKKGE